MRTWLRTAIILALPLAACGGESQPERVALSDAGAVPSASAASVSADTLVVYKSPTCGCCEKWVDHVKANGFEVVIHDMNDLTTVKQQHGVPAGRTSCHTATVRGYTIEGHVPADLIRRMLDEKAAFRGLAVPGMPMGSPGMEGLVSEKYDVLSFDDAGHTKVYATR